MRSTFRKRNFVMHLFGRHKQSAFQTLLTEWVCLDIAISDSFPSSAVSTAYSRVSVVLLVAFGFLVEYLETEEEDDPEEWEEEQRPYLSEED